MSGLRGRARKTRRLGSCCRVKLLLDENLSRRIVPALQDAFPGSTQVILAGLERADDRAVWEHAREHGYVIVTKDDEVEDSFLLHQPTDKIECGFAILHTVLARRIRMS